MIYLNKTSLCNFLLKFLIFHIVILKCIAFIKLLIPIKYEEKIAKSTPNLL